MSACFPYAVVATDLDGTLLNEEHRVSNYTKNVLKKLAGMGVFVVFATGRHHVDVLETMKKLDLYGYVIASNGARVYDMKNRLIFEFNMDPVIAKELVFLAANDINIVTSFYSGDSWFINKEAKDITEYYQDNKDVFFYQVFDPTTVKFDNVYKVYYTSDNRECLDALANKISLEYGDKVNFAFTLPNCLEVYPKEVNKGVALQHVVSLLFPHDYHNDDDNKRKTAEKEDGGSVIRHCIAFGDGRNDLEMLTMVEKGCVMKNAQGDLINMAPNHLEIIGKNTEDAVAHYLADIFALDVE